MNKLCFIVPVHGRVDLARICLRQLRRTCDALRDTGICASAVIVSDAETLATLAPRELGFGWVRRDNAATSRRFNDGIQLMTDPRYNPVPADYVVPCGSDDWVDHRLFLEPLPDDQTIFGFQQISFVREDGKEIASTFLNYEGGAGIRVIPRRLLEPVGYRPADEDRRRGCDTSILVNLRKAHGDRLKVRHWNLNQCQIVDWKTDGEQLNTYTNVTLLHRSKRRPDPFVELAEFYPAEALREMQAYYGLEVTA
jgi:hypothetical protein